MQFLIYFLMIFMFTFLPVVGILVEDQNSIYGLEHLKNANLIHICIMYVGLLLAYMKIKQKGYFWEKCGRACAVLHLDLLNTSETYRYGGTLQRQDTEKSVCHVPR